MKEKKRPLLQVEALACRTCLFAFHIFILFGISALSVQAQEMITSGNPSNLLDQQLGTENLPVFNGIRFYDLLRSDKTNFRYFKSYKPFIASITYKGETYDNIKTRYDLINDHLIIYSEGKFSFFQVQLANSKIDSFTLDDKEFSRIDLTQNQNVDKNAFYEKAFIGNNLDLLIAWSKSEKLKTRADNPFYTFDEVQSYYLKIKGSYVEIRKTRDVLKIFPERRKEIKEFSKAFQKTDPRAFMQRLAALLDKNWK